MSVRCSDGAINIRAGAIIIKDGKVLMVKNNRDDSHYSILPKAGFSLEKPLNRQ